MLQSIARIVKNSGIYRNDKFNHRPILLYETKNMIRWLNLIAISRVRNFISYVSRVALYYITKRRYILDFKSEFGHLYLSKDKGYSSNARWDVDSSELRVEHNIETWLVVRRDVIGHGITRRRYRRSLGLDTQYRWHMRNWSLRLTILLPWNRILESHEWQNNQIVTNKRSCQLYERVINIGEYLKYYLEWKTVLPSHIERRKIKILY